MRLMRDLLLVHVTDGAPTWLDDAAREGFSTSADYAAARMGELDRALALSGASPTRIMLGVSDQEATGAIPEIASALRSLFHTHGIRWVLTHAYEGGHPDHDAVAMAVHMAHPAPFEFAGYHVGADGGIVTGEFLGSVCSMPGVLDAADIARKRAMLACFWTQREILSHFDPRMEWHRVAPRYDFTVSPHPGRLLYETWGWMTGGDWRRRAGGEQCAA